MTTKSTGVKFSKVSHSWMASMVCNGTYIHLGYFETESEAQELLKKAREFEQSRKLDLAQKNITKAMKSKRNTQLVRSKKFKGVRWAKTTGKWLSSIYHGSRHVSIGWYDTELEAIEARKAANLQYGYDENHGSYL